MDIGFITGDAICHPVSYFFKLYSQVYYYDLFNVTVYSLKVVNIF
jgi:hypothetical protein